MSVTKSIDPGLCVQKLLELLLNVINQWMPTPVHKGYVWEVYVCSSFNHLELSISSPKPGKSRTLRFSLTSPSSIFTRWLWTPVPKLVRWRINRSELIACNIENWLLGTTRFILNDKFWVLENIIIPVCVFNIRLWHGNEMNGTFFWQTSARNMELMREALPSPDSPANIRLKQKPRFTARL